VLEVRYAPGGQWHQWRGPLWVSRDECAVYLGGDSLPAEFFRAAADIISTAMRLSTLQEFKDEAEKSFILAKLRENGWNVSKTAEAIDTPRSNLYKKIEQYNIKRETGGAVAVDGAPE